MLNLLLLKKGTPHNTTDTQTQTDETFTVQLLLLLEHARFTQANIIYII